jgi:cold shock protein
MASKGTDGIAPADPSEIERTSVCAIGNEANSVVELTGVIKWYDISKGYGFIVPDNGMADVLLHVARLRHDGYQVACKGARVKVAILQGPHGLQALRILSVDNSTAIDPAQMPPPRIHLNVTPTSALERAQVKWFNRLRGFGFLTRGEGTPDIFVHAEILRHCGLTELRTGAYILVRYGSGPKGLIATEVQPENASLGMVTQHDEKSDQAAAWQPTLIN